MRNLNVIFFGVLILLLCSFAPQAEKDIRTSYPFIIITPADSSDAAPVISEEDFYKMSASVIFKVNRTEIHQDDPFITLYRNEVLPMLNDDHLQLRKIFVRGAASPEGPYDNNRRLGRARTQALISEIRKDLKDQYAQADFEFSSITEDYAYLCILMEEKADPDAEYVRNICQKAGWNEPAIKNRLMAARGGSLWKRLVQEYFPQLRAARVILWFSESDKEHLGAIIAQRQHKDLENPAITFAATPLLAKSNYDLAYAMAPASQKDTLKPRRHLIAIRTNLVHDLFYMPKVGWTPSPNIQLEYYPLDGHWTANAGLTWGSYRFWDRQQFFQVRDFQLEARRYFKGNGQFTGLYLGAFAHGDVYGIGLNAEKGWQGEGGGAGISAGYVLPLNRRGSLRMEFMLALGVFFSRFDPYVYGNPVTGDIDGDYYYNYTGNASDFKKRNYQLTWFGPTNLGIQLTYDIIYRKRQK